MSLYRKHRPQKFNEVISQNHVIQTLSGALNSGQIGHAYIFAGPRGTGKTTMARILAKAVNCLNMKDSEPCDECDICKQIMSGNFLDLIEIDAASNRGIDEIRDLKEKIRFAPNVGKYKVYIIDEVHMLTREAFNALLKTLEEPPSHAIFILATTEVHKIPLTILSRCQRFDFRKIDSSDTLEELKRIAKKEKIKVEDDTLKKIVVLSEGSLRDALSFLDQVSAFSGGSDIDSGLLENILGYSNQDSLINILSLIKKKDTRGVIGFVNKLVGEGVDLDNFLKNLIRFIRQILLIKVDKDILAKELIDEKKLTEVASLFSIGDLVKLAEVLNEVNRSSKLSFIPQLHFELAIIKFLESEVVPKTDAAREPTPIKDVVIDKKEFDEAIKINLVQTDNTKSQEGFNLDEFLRKVKESNMSVAMALKGADLSLCGETLSIHVGSQFYFDRLDDSKSRKILKEAAHKYFGKEVELEITKSERKKEESEKRNIVAEALSVFGGEIIEE